MDDDFDFTKPQAAPPAAPPSPAEEAAAPSAPFKAANSQYYKPEIAEQLFRASGKEEGFAAGQVLFVEDDKASKGGLFSKKASRMYFLVEGEVALTIGGRPLDTLKRARCSARWRSSASGRAAPRPPRGATASRIRSTRASCRARSRARPSSR
jgi:hypothetical protein